MAGISPVVRLSAEDKIFQRGSSDPTLCTILQVDDADVQISLGETGSSKIPRSKIERVEIVTPASAQGGMKAFQGENFKQAIQRLEPFYAKYRCLPQEWIEQVTARLGESYLAVKEWTKAQELFSTFRKFYPESLLKDVARGGEAKALMGLNKKEAAKKILEEMMRDLEKETVISDDQSRALGRASVDLGRCYVAANQNDQALEAFLKTTTLYYMDSNAVAEALYESALVFEKLKNPAREKGQLESLLKDFPNISFAPDARKKLESIQSSNPEE